MRSAGTTPPSAPTAIAVRGPAAFATQPIRGAPKTVLPLITAM
jgi:hypothetical protein